MPLSLPSRETLALTIDNGTPEDYHLVRLYYSWYSGWFYRHRLEMVANLFGTTRVSRALEIGVGSGIFIKELLKHADSVAGIDVHTTYDGVRAMLRHAQVDLSRVELRKGDICKIPYASASFDAVVCISVLEHFSDPYVALREMKRVGKLDAAFLLGFPARNAVTDLLFNILGYAAKDIHPGSHTTILTALRHEFAVDAVQFFPPGPFPLYVACRARNKP